jgi:hypothetical protein
MASIQPSTTNGFPSFHDWAAIEAYIFITLDMEILADCPLTKDSLLENVLDVPFLLKGQFHEIFFSFWFS